MNEFLCSIGVSSGRFKDLSVPVDTLTWQNTGPLTFTIESRNCLNWLVESMLKVEAYWQLEAKDTKSTVEAVVFWQPVDS